MKFKLENVFTCLNAESLKIGSKVIFADSLDTLKKIVEGYNGDALYHKDNPLNDLANHIGKLAKIGKETSSHRFIKHNKDNLDTAWILAYLLEEPISPQYTPFNADNNLILKIVKSTESNVKTAIVAQDEEGVYLVDAYNLYVNDLFIHRSYQELLDTYTFMDDTPCGILIGK